MCAWSNWQFICEGRYDILLAILAGVALLCSVTLMLFSRYGASRAGRRAMRAERAAFLSGEGASRHSPFSRKTK